MVAVLGPSALSLFEVYVAHLKMDLLSKCTSASGLRIQNSERSRFKHLQGGGEAARCSMLDARCSMLLEGAHLRIEFYYRGITDMRVALICPESMKEYLFQDLSPVENVH